MTLLRDVQEIFGSYGEVTSVDLAVDKRVNLPKVTEGQCASPFGITVSDDDCRSVSDCHNVIVSCFVLFRRRPECSMIVHFIA